MEMRHAALGGLAAAALAAGVHLSTEAEAAAQKSNLDRMVDGGALFREAYNDLVQHVLYGKADDPKDGCKDQFPKIDFGMGLRHCTEAPDQTECSNLDVTRSDYSDSLTVQWGGEKPLPNAAHNCVVMGTFGWLAGQSLDDARHRELSEACVNAGTLRDPAVRALLQRGFNVFGGRTSNASLDNVQDDLGLTCTFVPPTGPREIADHAVRVTGEIWNLLDYVTQKCGFLVDAPLEGILGNAITLVEVSKPNGETVQIPEYNLGLPVYRSNNQIFFFDAKKEAWSTWAQLLSSARAKYPLYNKPEPDANKAMQTCVSTILEGGNLLPYSSKGKSQVLEAYPQPAGAHYAFNPNAYNNLGALELHFDYPFHRPENFNPVPEAFLNDEGGLDLPEAPDEVSPAPAPSAAPRPDKPESLRVGDLR